MMGAERRSMVMQLSEKELTAYHEAGHAITAINCPNSDPIHKATIIPRGRALGLVMRLPENDRFSVSRAKLHDDLIVAMGGRAAEELVFGYDKVTTGASSDIAHVTDLARNMVTKWGLSDRVGTIDYGVDDAKPYYNSQKDFSDQTAKIIDEEVKRIADEALESARQILKNNRENLEKLAKALLEFETLTGDEIKDLLAGKEIRGQKQILLAMIVLKKVIHLAWFQMLASNLFQMTKSRQEHQSAIFRNLDGVFTKRIVAIGENHADIVPKKFLAQNAVFLRSRGYNTVLFEHLSKGHNETLRQLKFLGHFTQHISPLDIRNIVAKAKRNFPGQEILDIDIENYSPEPFSPFEKLLFNIFQSDFGHTYHENEQLALQEYHEILTNDQSNKFNFLKVVKELLTNGVNVVGIENSQTIYRSQAGNVRAKHLNASIVYSLGQFLSTTAPAQKAIVFVGNTHLQRHQDYPIPGISCPIELASLQQEGIQDYFRSRVIGYKKLFEDSFFPQLIDNLPEQALDAPPVREGYSTPPREETYWPVVSLDNAKVIQENISSISFFQTRRGAGTFERDLIFINTTPREIMEFGTSRFFAERIVCLDRETNLKIEEVEGLVGFLRRIDDEERILLGYGNCEKLKILYQRDRDKATHSSGEAASLKGEAASREGEAAAAMHADEPSEIDPSEEVAAETFMISRTKRTSSSTVGFEEEAVFDEATSVEDGTGPKKARLDTHGGALGSRPLRLPTGPKNLNPRLDPGDSRDGPQFL